MNTTYPADVKSPHSVPVPWGGLWAGDAVGLCRTPADGGGAILFKPPGGGGKIPEPTRLFAARELASLPSMSGADP